MTEEKILKLIEETDLLISTLYKMLDYHTGLTEEQVMRVYEEIDEKEVYLEDLVSIYESKTGTKIPYNDKDGRYIFDDMFDKTVDFSTTNSKPRNRMISGNARLAVGKFRNKEETQKYIEDSLERELP